MATKKIISPVQSKVKIKTTKAPVKAVKKIVAKKAGKTDSEVSKVEKTVPVSGFSIPMVTIDGAKAGEVTLAHGVFDAKINATLLKMAIRVHEANNREGSASTKSRGEVEGSSKKIFKQKGTGRARHGSIRAPIFVHGGVAFGPRPHSFTLKMTESMKRNAFASALTSAFEKKAVVIVKDWSNLEPKTNKAAIMLKKLSIMNKATIVVSDKNDTIIRPVRNIKGITIVDAKSLATYDLLVSPQVIFSKQSVQIAAKRITE